MLGMGLEKLSSMCGKWSFLVKCLRPIVLSWTFVPLHRGNLLKRVRFFYYIMSVPGNPSHSVPTMPGRVLVERSSGGGERNYRTSMSRLRKRGWKALFRMWESSERGAYYVMLAYHEATMVLYCTIMHSLPLRKTPQSHNPNLESQIMFLCFQMTSEFESYRALTYINADMRYASSMVWYWFEWGKWPPDFVCTLQLHPFTQVKRHTLKRHAPRTAC